MHVRTTRSLPARRPRAAVLALSTLVLAVACGPDAGSGSGSTPTPWTSPTVDVGTNTATPRPTGLPTPTPTPTPPPEPSMAPTKGDVSRARAAVERLTPAEKAGQVIMATYDGTDAPVDLVGDYGLAGVIAMGYNIESATQIGDVNAALEETNDRPWPLLLGVDQEGGQIARLGAPLTEFPTYLTYGAADDAEVATDAAKASGTELRALGFTMVFAPVADVTSGPDDPTIGSRSAGARPRVVADVALASTRGYADAGVVPVLKHFPGHGSVPADSHLTLPVQDASLDELRERDLVPFAIGSNNGVPGVMVAHIDVTDVDSGTPSSLSSKVITDLLREDLGFDGLVVTDALNMAAIADAYGSGDAAVQSLLAGSDLLLMPADVDAAHAAILDALESGELPAERLDDAATTVVATAMHQQRTAGKQPPRRVLGRARAESYAASRAGLTIVSGACGKRRYVGEEVQVVGGSDTDRERFTQAAQDAGLEVGASGDVVQLLEYGTSTGSGDIVVALDTPYGLGESDAETAAIGLYGRTPDAFRALVDVLTGKDLARGTLPVPVSGSERPGCPATKPR